MRATLLSAIAIALFTISANAQTNQANQTVTLDLKDKIELTLTSNTPATLTFLETVNYVQGVEILNASTLTVKSNKIWKVTARAESDYFTGGVSDKKMPANLLNVKLDNGAYSPLTSALEGVTLKEDGPRGINNYSVAYKAIPGFEYEAGTYTLSVLYTATAD